MEANSREVLASVMFGFFDAKQSCKTSSDAGQSAILVRQDYIQRRRAIDGAESLVVLKQGGRVLLC